MILTEEEAKTKFCPHMRLPFHYDGDAYSGLNVRGTDRKMWAKCIASGCMMWRDNSAKGDEEPRGFCGLAYK